MRKKSKAILPFEGISKSEEDFNRLGMKVGNVPEVW